MKLWKKISENRYELFLKEPFEELWDAVLYIENDGTMNFSYGFNGAHCSHRALLAVDIDMAKKEIEKILLDETVKTLNIYQKMCKERIRSLSESE